MSHGYLSRVQPPASETVASGAASLKPGARIVDIVASSNSEPNCNSIFNDNQENNLVNAPRQEMAQLQKFGLSNPRKQENAVDCSNRHIAPSHDQANPGSYIKMSNEEMHKKKAPLDAATQLSQANKI